MERKRHRERERERWRKKDRETERQRKHQRPSQAQTSSQKAETLTFQKQGMMRRKPAEKNSDRQLAISLLLA